MKKHKAILVSDVKGWAFDVNNRDMAKYLHDDFIFDFFYIAENNHSMVDKYEFIFLPYHNWPLCFLGVNVVGALRSSSFDPLNQGVIDQNHLAYVRNCKAFQCCTLKSYRQLDGESNVKYLTNPVDMDRFPSLTTVRDEIVVCWTGNAMHFNEAGFDVKGFYSILIPAISNAEVPFKIAEYNTCKLRPFQMSAFFQQANVCLCASLYEGASNSVMEAMASGLAVICTDVGNHREMYNSQMKHFGKSGIIFAERSIEAFTDAINHITPRQAREMGEINRQEIEERWSWKVWAPRYKEFFLSACDK